MNKRLSKHYRLRQSCITLALMSLFLSSCSTDDGLTTATSPGQLTFNVCTDQYGSGTRGTPMNSVSGTVGLIGFEFSGEWDADEEKTYLMFNEVMQGSGEIWKTSKSYLPDVEKKKRFYAYYPYQTDVDTEGGIIQFNSGDGTSNTIIPYFDYTSPTKASEQKDLMYAVSDDVSHDSEGVLQPIELEFHHLLAALRINIVNGFDNGTIKKVSLSKIHNKSRFEYYNLEWGEPEQDVTTITQDVEVKVTTKNTDILPLTNETQYFMLLPQELEQSAKLEIVYDNGNNEYTLSYDLGKARIMADDGNGGTEQRKLKFEAGKITTLNITVESITKLTIRCTLADWNSGAVFGGDNADQELILLDSTLDDWEGFQGSDEATGTSTEKDVTTGPGGNYKNGE